MQNEYERNDIVGDALWRSERRNLGAVTKLPRSG
jgi:hypothetical protein